MAESNPAYLNVFTVEEFETTDGKTARNWTKIGVAFPHSDGTGFNVQLKALPLDGKFVVRPPNAEREDAASEPRPTTQSAMRPARATAANGRERGR